MLKGRMWWTLGFALLFAGACGSSESVGLGGEGTVTGKVTAADGTTPVALANVFAQSKGSASGTLSDVSGNYTLTSVPAGSQTIIAEKGTFRATTTVNVAANQSTAAPAAKLAPLGKLGYVSGSFDNIQAIVTQLGYPIESVATATLASSTALAQYKMLFLNCGAGISTEPATVNALKAWVQAGGILYASDWELDVIQAMFPNDILAVASGDEQTITASVTNTALQQFIGKTSATIAYDLGAWKMLKSISNVPSVLLRGNVTGFDETTSEQQAFTNQPLAISITHGQGRVVYTTFHNEAGVTADQVTVLRYFIHF